MTTTQTAELASQVERIKAAPDAEALGPMYADLVGYDPFQDDPAITTEDVRSTLLDFVREICFSQGIHCADVGLGQEETP